MDSQTILPTHKCFDDSLDFVAERVKIDPSLAFGTSLVVVHGICVAPEGPHAGERFAHAWVEEEMPLVNDGPGSIKVVWSSGLLNGQRVYVAAAKDEYYAHLQVQDVTVYTLRQVHHENVRSGHYGPWDDKYRALCGEGKRVYGAIAHG